MAEEKKTAGLLGSMDESLVNSYRKAQLADIPLGAPKMDFMDMGKMSTLLENVRGMYTSGGTTTTDGVQEPASYTVKEGDNLTKIAEANNMTLDELLEANPEYKDDPNFVESGAELKIPGTSTGTTTTGTTTTTTDGRRKSGAQIVKERRERLYGTNKKDFKRRHRQVRVNKPWGDKDPTVMTEEELRKDFEWGKTNTNPETGEPYYTEQHFEAFKDKVITEKQSWREFKRGKQLRDTDELNKRFKTKREGLGVKDKVQEIKARKTDKKIDAVNQDAIDGWANNYQRNQTRSANAKKMQNLLIDAGYEVGEGGADGRWTTESQAAYDKWKEEGGYQPGKVKAKVQEKVGEIRDRKSTEFKNRELDKKLVEYTPDQVEGWQSEYDADPEAVNEDVKVIQQMLIDRGYGNVIDSEQNIPGVDGRFGPETKAAYDLYLEENPGGVSDRLGDRIRDKRQEKQEGEYMLSRREFFAENPGTTQKDWKKYKTDVKASVVTAQTFDNFDDFQEKMQIDVTEEGGGIYGWSNPELLRSLWAEHGEDFYKNVVEKDPNWLSDRGVERALQQSKRGTEPGRTNMDRFVDWMKRSGKNIGDLTKEVGTKTKEFLTKDKKAEGDPSNAEYLERLKELPKKINEPPVYGEGVDMAVEIASDDAFEYLYVPKGMDGKGNTPAVYKKSKGTDNAWKILLDKGQIDASHELDWTGWKETETETGTDTDTGASKTSVNAGKNRDVTNLKAKYKRKKSDTGHIINFRDVDSGDEPVKTLDWKGSKKDIKMISYWDPELIDRKTKKKGTQVSVFYTRAAGDEGGDWKLINNMNLINKAYKLVEEGDSPTPFKSVSPLKQAPQQPAKPLLPQSNPGTQEMLNTVIRHNDTNARIIEDTGASLNMPYFKAVEDWNKEAVEKIQQDETSDSMTNAISTQNQLAQLNEREKMLRLDYSDLILNNEVSNYRREYMHTFIAEYFNPKTERQLAMNPDSGQYEYMFKSNLENRFILETEVRRNLAMFSVDVEGQADVLRYVNSILGTIGTPTKKQPDRAYFNSIAKDIVKKGKITSKIHDDMLNNGSSFIKDFQKHPAFQQTVSQLPEQAFVKEPGEMNWYDNISQMDMSVIMDAITNPDSQFFNFRVSPNDELGLTETLLVEYIAGYFEEQYNNALNVNVKGPQYYIDKYKERKKQGKGALQQQPLDIPQQEMTPPQTQM